MLNKKITQNIIFDNCPNLYKLINVKNKQWKNFDKAYSKRSEYLKRSNNRIIGNIYDIIENSHNDTKAKSILTYTEQIASDLLLNLSDKIKSKLKKNSAQIFDPSVDGKQVFFERLAELRLIQQFAIHKDVNIIGVDVQIENTKKDLDLVIIYDSTKFNLEFVSIRLDPDKIESFEGITNILENRINEKISIKFSNGIPSTGSTMIIPIIFTDIAKLLPYIDIFKISPDKPFRGIVPFFYMAYSGKSRHGNYIWGIDEAYCVLTKNT